MRTMRLGAMLSVFAAAVALAACGGGETADQASSGATSSGDAHGGTLTLGLSTAPGSLDPATAGGGIQSQMLLLAYDTPFRVKPDGSFEPALATSWRYVGHDNTQFELTLREDARYSDGSPVTAASVKTWLDYFAKADPGSADSISFKSVDVVDDKTVRITLKKPNPVMRHTLAAQNWGYFASTKAAERPSLFGTRTFGAGPYVLDPDESVTNDHYTFVPNKYYYDKSKIRYDRIVVRIISRPGSMLQAMQTKQIDVAIGDPTTAAAAESAGLTVLHAPNGVNGIIVKDLQGRDVKPYGDVRVRQAMNYAVDREAISKAIVGEYGGPTDKFANIDVPASDLSYDYDPAKAKSLLSAAGYPNGFSMKVLTPGFQGNMGDTFAQAVAKYMKAVGIDMQVQSSPTAADMFAKWDRAPAVVWGWGAQPLWLNYLALLKGADPELERMATAAGRSDDPASHWQEMSDYMVRQGFFVPVLAYDRIVYVSDRVQIPPITKWVEFVPLWTQWSPAS